jgi:hypothetical protein
LSLASGKPLQPNLMSVSKVGAYPSGEKLHQGPISSQVLSRLFALPTNRLSWTGMQGTNTIAYYVCKKFYNIGFCGLYHKHITIVNDDSIVIRMILLVVASPMIIILMA